MKSLKRIFHKIFYLPGVITGTLALASAGLLIYVFTAGDAPPAVTYTAYLLSSYAFVLVCLRVPPAARRIKAAVKSNKYLRPLFDSASLRVIFSLYGSAGMNVFYVVMQLWLGFSERSVWFFALAGYYLLLALIRFYLLKAARRDELGLDLRQEYVSYCICGASLLLMNLVLSVIAAYIVVQNRSFDHHYIVTIAMAAYTFFTFTVSIVNLVRYKKYNSPVMSASKAVNLAAALVSVLSLETSMLSAFGGESGAAFRRAMTASTGAVVCAAILTMAVYMIVRAARQLKRLKKEAPGSH